MVQGKEPRHFVEMWQGRMVVHLGGVASGFSTLEQDDESDAASTRLYHIKSSASGATHAVQVEAAAPSLNSGAPGCRLLRSSSVQDS